MIRAGKSWFDTSFPGYYRKKYQLFGNVVVFCRKCSDFFGLAQVVFGVAIVLAVMLTARGLYINSDVPDPTGLRRDTFFAAVSGLFIGVPANILQQLDVGGFSMQTPQTFDFVSFYL